MNIPAPPSRGGWFRFYSRAWLLRPPASAPGSSAGPVIVLLSLLALSGWAYLDWRASAGYPQWTPYNVPLLAWYALGIILFAALLRWRASPGLRFNHALSLSLGMTPYLLVFLALPEAVDRHSWVFAVQVLIGVAMTVYLLRGMTSLTGRAQRSAVVWALVFMAGFFYLSDRLNVVPTFWMLDDTEPVHAADVDAESLLFDQQARLDEVLGRLPPATDHGPVAYFLGFAGVGDQRVFTEEIGLAGRVLGEKFPIGSRAVSLLNDERDLERAPLATGSALRYALSGLADKMNRDEDVLFLAISSHGSKDASIAVADAGLPLNDLSADDLADALRESGIRWRVVIISACYAGGFIEPLKNPYTIVITAAAKDRTSFGCSNDRDLTYFGEAFYRDSLPSSKDLRNAFDTAKAKITARETAEHETPSEPQAYFGGLIEAKLAGMQAHFN